MTASPITTPFHLDGNYRPVTTELTESELPVEGTIPEATQRPLPPQRTQPPTRRPVDALVLRRRHDPRRRALGRTRPLVSQPLGPHDHLHRRRDAAPLRLAASTARAGLANTNVIAHAGRTLALVETSFPYELTNQLDTVGPYDFDGRLTTAMTAHPKICPTTGELHFFGYALTPPYLTYHCADANGRLIQSTEIDVPGPTMMHDFAITATHVVFFDLPVVFDIERALAGTMPFRWDDNYGARIGLLPRNQPDANVTWHDIEPCYVFHVLNAYDSDDGVVIDALRYPELWRTGPDQFGGATLHRWTLPRNGSPVRETPTRRQHRRVPAHRRPIHRTSTPLRLRDPPHRSAAKDRSFATTSTPARPTPSPSDPDASRAKPSSYPPAPTPTNTTDTSSPTSTTPTATPATWSSCAPTNQPHHP